GGRARAVVEPPGVEHVVGEAQPAGGGGAARGIGGREGPGAQRVGRLGAHGEALGGAGGGARVVRAQVGDVDAALVVPERGRRGAGHEGQGGRVRALEGEAVGRG